jgi:hypothetical protein
LTFFFLKFKGDIDFDNKEIGRLVELCQLIPYVDVKPTENSVGRNGSCPVNSEQYCPFYMHGKNPKGP